MRICSLLPSATEIIFALGLGDQLVGVSHTCDFPPEARRLPVLTRSLRRRPLATNDIPVHAVWSVGVSPSPAYALDGELLRQLRPDLILTQDICNVCAIGRDTVFEVAANVLGYAPAFVTIRAAGLDDILQNILAIGQATEAGAPAKKCVDGLQARIEAVRDARTSGSSSRVLCLEWARPLRAAGLWVPEMVEIAGGLHGLTGAGERSRKVGWDEISAVAPEIVLFMPCGYDLAHSRAELASVVAEPEWGSLPVFKTGDLYVFDGRVPSRHGPRIVDVLEAFAEILRPGRVTRHWHDRLYEVAN